MTKAYYEVEGLTKITSLNELKADYDLEPVTGEDKVAIIKALSDGLDVTFDRAGRVWVIDKGNRLYTSDREGFVLLSDVYIADVQTPDWEELGYDASPLPFRSTLLWQAQQQLEYHEIYSKSSWKAYCEGVSDTLFSLYATHLPKHDKRSPDGLELELIRLWEQYYQKSFFPFEHPNFDPYFNYPRKMK